MPVFNFGRHLAIICTSKDATSDQNRSRNNSSNRDNAC